MIALSPPLFLLWVAYAPSQLLTQLAGIGIILTEAIAHAALSISGSGEIQISRMSSRILPTLERDFQSDSVTGRGEEAGRNTSTPSIEVRSWADCRRASC